MHGEISDDIETDCYADEKPYPPKKEETETVDGEQAVVDVERALQIWREHLRETQHFRM